MRFEQRDTLDISLRELLAVVVDAMALLKYGCAPARREGAANAWRRSLAAGVALWSLFVEAVLSDN